MKHVNFCDEIEFLEGPGVRNWQFTDSGVKLINIRNLVNDKIDLSNTKNHLSNEEVSKKYSHFLLEEGDYVMASSGVTWGKIAEVRNEHLPLCLNTSIIKLKPKNNNVEKKYLWHFIKSHEFTRQIDKIITGSAQPNFGPSHLKKIKMPLPEVMHQQKIVHILDEADALRQKDKTLLGKYDELAQALFLDMFGDPVSNPKGWEKRMIGDLHKISSGGTPSREKPEYFINGKIPWVKTGDLKELYASTPSEYITELALSNSSAKIFPKNTLLVAMYGATIGACSILNFEAATNQACAALLPSSKINIHFEYFFFKQFKSQIIKLGVGGAQPNISAGILKSLKIYYPPLPLQDRFGERVKLIYKQQDIARKSLEKSEQLFNSFLQKAFKGELT